MEKSQNFDDKYYLNFHTLYQPILNILINQSVDNSALFHKFIWV